MQHFVGRYGVEYALQAPDVWSVQEEFLPESVGQLGVLIFLLCVVLAKLCSHGAECAHFEQRFIEANDFGLEDLWPRVLRERRWLHDGVVTFFS